ncbi:hypothetical protein J7J69_05810 [candidate division WOR-3 bacterium]|nr:hypothetical protein [candidate division WOR-3 bacterium]
MSQYLTDKEEKQIRNLLDELANKLGLYCEKKEAYFSGYYIDRLWFKILEGNRIPLVAFEIEKSIPNNERIRKDIMNIAWSRVPVGYIILPHSRIIDDTKVKKGSSWAKWYKNNFFRVFNEYCNPFIFYCDIQLVDADKLISTQSLKESIVSTMQ